MNFSKDYIEKCISKALNRKVECLKCAQDIDFPKTLIFAKCQFSKEQNYEQLAGNPADPNCAKKIYDQQAKIFFVKMSGQPFEIKELSTQELKQLLKAKDQPLKVLF